MNTPKFGVQTEGAAEGVRRHAAFHGRQTRNTPVTRGMAYPNFVRRPLSARGASSAYRVPIALDPGWSSNTNLQVWQGGIESVRSDPLSTNPCLPLSSPGNLTTRQRSVNVCCYPLLQSTLDFCLLQSRVDPAPPHSSPSTLHRYSPPAAAPPRRCQAHGYNPRVAMRPH